VSTRHQDAGGATEQLRGPTGQLRGATEQLLTWVRGDGLIVSPPAQDRLLVADSWLVDDGAVRALARHQRRFEAAVRPAAGELADDLCAFWAAAVDRLPRRGRWFPRVELTAAQPRQLRLRIRPAPALGHQIRVWADAGRDERRRPRHKGPDLEWLGRVRARAVELGAGEALLTTPAGLVLEAAYASVLWWEDDVLCVPDPALRVLPGVTTGLIQKQARQRGLPVRSRRIRLDELAGREVWLVNALHGIRVVDGWIGSGIGAGEPARATAWRLWLKELAEPLPVGGTAEAFDVPALEHRQRAAAGTGKSGSRNTWPWELSAIANSTS
jgi:branched-subunit amino acid aminotransferase/4-amino-4-deoxychorismate lyase